MSTKNVVVAGGGGFIGGHLVRDLVSQGHRVHVADVKPIDQWWQVAEEAVNHPGLDVGDVTNASALVPDGADEVYNLAADMGGMGFIHHNKLDCMLSVLPSTAMLQAARHRGVGMFFYSSSACVYPDYRQTETDVRPLREEDAYPAMPEDGYGWEKLFTERLCRHFLEDAGLQTRVARYHNVYGPQGTWTGGREKAPAALSRKIATAVLTGESSIEIWGDGEATRTFMYVDDCVEGTQMIARADSPEPVNLGSEELVSINHLATLIEQIAGVELRHEHVEGPQGVRGRSSDNTVISERYGWAPSIKLVDGLERTYSWVYDQVKHSLGR
ncbi:Nucleoside-diphosphate-sugar epimerase [Blastococcus fimeti]|nr:Nucleoside-diphosphate-sugar epimerase [Blastococcus fimeti]